MECPELEGTPRNHQLQLLAQDNPKMPLIPKSQHPELWLLGAVTIPWGAVPVPDTLWMRNLFPKSTQNSPQDSGEALQDNPLPAALAELSWDRGSSLMVSVLGIMSLE